MSARSGDPLERASGVTSEQLAAVLALIGGTDIAELEVTLGSTRLHVRRPPLVVAANASDAEPMTSTASAELVPLAITSPLVGIFRAAVASGDTVQPGQSIGAIEALGMPTSVEAPQSGTVEHLLVEDGSPVEYGQPLLTLRRATHGA